MTCPVCGSEGHIGHGTISKAAWQEGAGPALIVSASISPPPRSLFDAMPKVTVVLEDGTSVELFSYYPDEISFKTEEFIGLTLEQARRLKFEKDRKFLQS